MTKIFTLHIFVENNFWILNRILLIFSRRCIEIISITASASEIQNLYEFVVVLKTTKEKALKVEAQIEKVVEVFKCYVHQEGERADKDISLFNIKKQIQWQQLTLAE